MTNLIATTLFFLFANTSFLFAQLKAVYFGELIDGQGKKIVHAVVIIDADRIINVGAEKEISVPPNAEKIDLRSYTAIPGLIDAHTHITFYWDRAPGSNPWGQLGSLGPIVTVFLAQENARKTLEAGVTTIRDLGSFDRMDFGLRDLINRGAIIGPRMFVSGYGLHIGPSRRQPDPGQADGIDEVQRVARAAVAAGADWIKMYGSTGSAKDVTGFQTFTYEEMKAAAVVAHQAGKRIAIHSYGPDGARDAVKAGANTIEHATDMDEATLAEMSRLGIIYVPTIDHNRYYIAHKDEYGYGSADVANLNNYINRNLETVKKAIKAKVKIAMGSDAVFTGFGENTRELEWFVKAGMTPEQALRTATTTGAEMLGMENDLGAIAPGYYADLVAVEGDPMKDINVIIHNVKWVMKAGKVVIDKTKNTISK